MKKLNIFLGTDYFEKIYGEILGVDASSEVLIANGHSKFTAIGDFDSVEDFDLVKENCKIIGFPSQKDEGDLELAIQYAIENKYADILVYNINCGNRLDHFINNLKIIYSYSDQINIAIKDRFNYGYFISGGSHEVIDYNYRYISFLTFEKVKHLKLINFLYEYDDKANINSISLVSNQFIDNSGYVEIADGTVLCLYSNDD